MSQNAGAQALNFGATTPIEAPINVNWLYLPIMLWLCM
jgi:hypothetical protein